MRLNGWKRLGIISSVVWILGAGFHTYTSEMDGGSKAVSFNHVVCDANLKGKTGDAWTRGVDECNRQADELLRVDTSNARMDAANIALFPVPLGWGLAYLILFLARWARRGFVPPTQ